MTAEISVIVPTLNAERTLPACLSALIEGVMAGLIHELIVTDGGSTDATLAIARDAGANLVSGPASRGGQLRRAAKTARGRWLLVIHADTILEPGWADVVARHIEAGEPVPGAFRLRFRARGLWPAWVAGWANLRSQAFGLPYGDQGLLVTRAAYDRAGGYPDIPLMEDVALVRALARRPQLLPVFAATGAERYERAGWLRRGTRNLWTLTRYLAGSDPERLARDYQN